MFWRIRAFFQWLWEYITLTPKKYDEVLYKLECLLCHATGYQYSKAGYRLEDMCQMVDDYITECCDEAIADEVTYCRDCVYCKDNKICIRKAKSGGYHSIDRVHANFYCAAGKRRKENGK